MPPASPPPKRLIGPPTKKSRTQVQVTGSIQAIARAHADPQALAPDTHIVARSEAHDSGLCRADQASRRRFSEDLRNLTLAAPSVNRHQKRDHDASEWQPPMNRYWFANRVVQVTRAYGLSVYRRERDTLVRTLAGCADTAIDMTPRGTVAAASPPAGRGTARASGGTDALALYDDNGNGRITCAEARRHGIGPVPRTHPAYRYMRDGDGDGVVCE